MYSGLSGCVYIIIMQTFEIMTKRLHNLLVTVYASIFYMYSGLSGCIYYIIIWRHFLSSMVMGGLRHYSKAITNTLNYHIKIPFLIRKRVCTYTCIQDVIIHIHF